MNNTFTESSQQWFQFNKNWANSVNSFNQITTQTFRDLARQNLELIGENFNRFSDQMRRFSTIKRPEEFVDLGRECINENISASVETLQNILQMYLTNIDKLSEATQEAGRETMQQARHATGATKERKSGKSKKKN
jgi:hypothetical protein